MISETRVALQNITDPKGFESLCNDVMFEAGYRDIEPLGGSQDQGRDALHVERSEGLITLFCYSLRKDWEKKLKEDLWVIKDNGHTCDQVVFVTNQEIPTPAGVRLKKFAQETYGWVLELYPFERLRMLIDASPRVKSNHPGIFALSASASEREGRAPAPDVALEDLQRRGLTDPADPNFANTIYSRNLAAVDRFGAVKCSHQTAALLFARWPAALFDEAGEGDFLNWMSPNARRYPPITYKSFIPSPELSPARNGHVWHDAGMFSPQRSASRACRKYLVIERTGYVEYGFVPREFFSEGRDHVYYAAVVGGFVAFLRFVQEMAAKLTLSPNVHVGLCLRGTRDTTLRCLFKDDYQVDLSTAPAADDGFLFHQTPEGSEPWEVNKVAKRAARELLAHWSYVGYYNQDPPEFRDGVYVGTVFMNRFQGWW